MKKRDIAKLLQGNNELLSLICADFVALLSAKAREGIQVVREKNEEAILALIPDEEMKE